jgi:hypothetical protein
MAFLAMLDKGMTTLLSAVCALSDAALLAQVTALAERERQATAELIASLAELDGRRLYLGAGYRPCLPIARTFCISPNTLRMAGSRRLAP